MEIKFECKVSKMRIRSDEQKSVEVSLIDEITVCGTKKYLALNTATNQPYLIDVQNISIENVSEYFDFISIHSKEMFEVTITNEVDNESTGASVCLPREGEEEQGGSSETKQRKTNVNVSKNKIIINNEDFYVKSVELIYG